MVQCMTQPVDPMVMGTLQHPIHSEMAPSVKCYVVCNSMTVSQVLHGPGWWCWLRLCLQERQIHSQNNYLFLWEFIMDSSRLKGVHCSHFATVRPVGLLSVSLCCFQFRHSEVTVTRWTLGRGCLCCLPHVLGTAADTGWLISPVWFNLSNW